MANINCIFHDDRTASMKIYGPVAYCFVCCIQVPTSSLNMRGLVKETPRQEPTNIPERIKYIKNLPKKHIRGFDLHSDDSGFYIIWPGENYYKKRTNGSVSRYIGPAGVRAPLLAFPGLKDHLIVVEGELNAMSLYNAVYGDYTVVSPGSASEFMRHIPLYKGYKKVTLVLDYDAAGIVHGSQTKEVLLKSEIDVRLVLMEIDFNDIFTKQGEDKVREVFEKEVL